MEISSSAKPQRTLDSYLPAIESLLKEIVQFGEFQLAWKIRKGDYDPADVEAPEYVVDFSGADAELLLEKNATLLNAVEYLVLKAVRLDESLFGRITFDCEDFRRLRVEELKMTAQVAAQRVIETGDAFTLNPMNPRERRIVHMALKDLPGVRTASEGTGPERKVVIHPAAPPRPARC